MTNFQRKEQILGLIDEIWTKNPDLRLTQLIGNCFDSGDNYYVTDEKLEEALRRTYQCTKMEE
jgi:uncharacterized protein YihD (DUF1040 family)